MAGEGFTSKFSEVKVPLPNLILELVRGHHICHEVGGRGESN